MANFSFSITDFQGVIDKRGGLSTTNRYVVYIAAPEDFAQMQSDIPYLCEVASFPSRSIATADQKIYGPMRKIARESLYGDISLSFIVTEDFKIKDHFDSWLNKIQDPVSYDPSYYDSYIGTLYIGQLKNSGTPNLPTSESSNFPYSIELQEAYPTLVGDLQLNWSDNNVYHKLQVNFAYRRWLNRKIDN